MAQVPRSARSRKISFKDESERKVVKEDSDEMSEEEEVRVDQSEASIYSLLTNHRYCGWTPRPAPSARRLSAPAKL